MKVPLFIPYASFVSPSAFQEATDFCNEGTIGGVDGLKKGDIVGEEG